MFHYISGLIILTPILKGNGKQKIHMNLSQNYDFVFTNLFKESAELLSVKNYLFKALFTRDIFADDISIKIKRYCDKKIILSH